MTKTNEHREQKPEIQMCKCGASYLDDQHPICPECMTEETTVPPQEVEAKWTYKVAFTQNERYHIVRPDGTILIGCWYPKDRDEIIDRFNELDRLRSYQGKVPSDDQIYIHFSPRSKNANECHLKMLGAQWMRSEVSPYILKLESRIGDLAVELDLKVTECSLHLIEIDSLRSELKAAKEALSEVREEMAVHGSLHGHKTLFNKVDALLTPKKD